MLTILLVVMALLGIKAPKEAPATEIAPEHARAYATSQECP